MADEHQKIIRCPDCGKIMKKRVGAPAELYECACGKDWVMCLGKLVTRQEFHQTADIYNG